MLKWGQRKGVEDYASDGDNPPNKAYKDPGDNSDDDIVVCEISKNRIVSVRNWQGKGQMSKWGNRKGLEDYASDGDTLPKKTCKDSGNDSDNDIVVCEISKNLRVSMRNWRGKVVMDIREFNVKIGKRMPSKKVLPAVGIGALPAREAEGRMNISLPGRRS